MESFKGTSHNVDNTNFLGRILLFVAFNYVRVLIK